MSQKAVRRTYNPITELGPTFFTVGQKNFCSRVDFEVRNRRYKTLKCSLFHHDIIEDKKCPLIVFCHGNSGNRTYSYEIVSRMLQANISVLTFDFAGDSCGLSEGKYIFQGFFEQYDIEDVLEYALEKYPFIDRQRIGLWGRSMGAIAALLFASHSRLASLVIVDSPFKDFSDILNEYMSRLKIIPNILARYISNNLRSKILRLCSFDFEELKPIEAIATCRAAALFHHTSEDRIVPNYHSKDLFEAYPAEKEYLETKGGHNSQRSDGYYETVLKFIHKIFSKKKENCEKPGIGTKLDLRAPQPKKQLEEDEFEEMLDDDEIEEKDITINFSVKSDKTKSNERNQSKFLNSFTFGNESVIEEKSSCFGANLNQQDDQTLFNEEEDLVCNSKIKDVSKTVSEPISNIKPKLVKLITSTRNSFFQQV